MPIIYTYPSVTPTAEDLLLISDVSETNPTKATRKCSIGDVVSLVTALVPGGGTVTSVDVSGGTTGLTTSGGPVTTSGTITLAGTLDADNGGTGQSSYTQGDIVYYDATATQLDKLGIGAAGELLTVAGGLPSWAAASSVAVTSIELDLKSTGLLVDNGADPAASSVTLTTPGGEFNISGTLIVSNGGTGVTSFSNGYFVKGNNATTLTEAQYVDLTSEVTGTLPVTNGGTGAATLTDGGFLLGSGASDPVTATARPTNGQLPIGNTGSDPTITTLTAGANITITNGAGSITIASAAGAPAKVAYDNQLTLRGGTSGTYTPNTSSLAQYWTIGDYVYMEFYLSWSSAHLCVGTVIMEGLPLTAISPVGATVEQGSCLVTSNDGWGTGVTTQAPQIGRTGVTAGDEIIFRAPNANGKISDILWTHLDGDAGPYTLAGTATWLLTSA